MIQFFGRFIKLPVEAFVYSMEMLVKTMRGIQHIAYQGIDVMADWGVEAPVDAPDSSGAVSEVSHAVPEITYAAPEVIRTVPEGTSSRRAEDTHVITPKEERKMPDRDLSDDMLKLVRYKVLFVKRDYEQAFPEKEELVSENTDAAGYTAWKIAEFIQDLPNTEIPRKWQDKKYPRDVGFTSPPDSSPKINSLPEDDKKYLRVYYEVLERYTRERFKYEERQIEVLEQIRDKMKDP